MDRHNWDQQNYGTGFHDGAYQRKTSKSLYGKETLIVSSR